MNKIEKYKNYYIHTITTFKEMGYYISTKEKINNECWNDYEEANKNNLKLKNYNKILNRNGGDSFYYTTKHDSHEWMTLFYDIDKCKKAIDELNIVKDFLE